ncbi:hypothetical protein [uncultured Clostridium sp.]|uniref:hypothetical protein n=1 Tax=uncultured Clostridium sp. TaxID=59620 RepID=UPI002623B310|nr:hypothetical protein [uncultured Clostridium sp.]
MNNKLFEFTFNFTKEDLENLFNHVSDYYTENTKATKGVRLLKYTFLFAFILGIGITLSDLFTKNLTISNAIIFILTIMSFIVFTQISITPKGFKSSFLRYIGTKPLKISITDTTISRQILLTGKPFKVNLKFANLSTILFHDDITILIFKNFCLPIKLVETSSDYTDILTFLNSKISS